MSLYVIRHGQTSDDVPGQERPSGWSNVPLDKEGIARAHETGKFLANKNIHHIFTSDLLRAHQTALILAQHTGAKVYPTPALRAVNWGQIAGHAESGIKPYMNYYREHPDKQIPGGETFGDSIKRFSNVLPTFIKLADRIPTQNFAAVSHSENINMIPSIISGGRDPISRIHLVPDAGIVHIQRDINGTLKAMPITVTKGEAING